MIPRLVRRLALAVYALLWLGGVAAYCRGTAAEHVRWGAPGFLLCGALLVVLNAAGARGWLLAVGLAGFLAELAGSRTGWPFGPYSYTGALGPQLAGVPLAMSCAWIVLIAYVKSFDGALPGPAALRLAAGALWMVAIDLAIEPVAAGGLDYWRWHVPGAYHGVPWQNFAGWFLVSLLWLATGLRYRTGGAWARRVGLSVVVFFGVLGACRAQAAPAAVTIALSAWHVGLERRLRAVSSPAGSAEPAAKL